MNSNQITEAILANWGKEEVGEYVQSLPSAHQIFDRVKVFLMPEGENNFPGISGKIIGIHFYPGKVKYDVELLFSGNFNSRVYNVDSVLVTK